MGQQPRAEIMTLEQMNAMNREYANSRLYDKNSGNAEKVSEAVGAITEQIMTAPHGRIQLNDTETVKATAFQYITSCQRAGIIPSKIGLSRALGVTRRSLDTYVVRNPESDTGVFLSMLFDSFAEMLSMSTMTGATREIFGIFLLKAIYNFRDAIAIETPALSDPDRPPLTAEQLMEKYADLPD